MRGNRLGNAVEFGRFRALIDAGLVLLCCAAAGEEAAACGNNGGTTELAMSTSAARSEIER